jgi:methylase of polypeptide subunit release factors
VDLNPEAVQICQLSLWIKTAAHGKALTSLHHTIREGNSVVADPAVHPKAFDWQAAFPEVFATGGFDVVIGNPPYIRQEWLAPFKPYLNEQRDHQTRLTAALAAAEADLNARVYRLFNLTPEEIMLLEKEVEH